MYFNFTPGSTVCGGCGVNINSDDNDATFALYSPGYELLYQEYGACNRFLSELGSSKMSQGNFLVSQNMTLSSPIARNILRRYVYEFRFNYFLLSQNGFPFPSITCTMIYLKVNSKVSKQLLENFQRHGYKYVVIFSPSLVHQKSFWHVACLQEAIRIFCYQKMPGMLIPSELSANTHHRNYYFLFYTEVYRPENNPTMSMEALINQASQLILGH